MASGIHEQVECSESRWDCVVHPTHAYTHAFREVDAQFSAREWVVENLLLTEGRAS